MPDGRRIIVDKRNIGFMCEAKREEFGGKRVVIVGWKGWAKAVPVVEGYEDLKSWWRLEPSANDRPPSCVAAGDHGPKSPRQKLSARTTRLHDDAESVVGAE
jgi:hypothetical protein